MTRAVACALLAGIAGVVALADLAAARAGPSRRERGGEPDGGAHPAIHAWPPHPAGRGAHRGSTQPRLLRLLTLLARLGRRLGVPGAPGDLAALVAAAGAPLGLEAADVMAVKGAGALVGGLAGLPAAAAAPGRLGVVALLAAPAAGFLVPDAWLRRRARARAAAMARELPDVLDLLRVAVEAGLPVSRALADVGRRHPGALAAELRAAAGAIELGVPRADVLRAVPRRAPLPAVGALVAAIERSERHGAPLSPALAALATESRADASRVLAERAARAAPKLQLAVALLLVPAVLLLVAAGAVAAFVPH